MPQRGASVLGSGERRHVRGGEIVHRADAPFIDRDSDQHRRDRLGHRPGREPIPVGPRVLIALDEDRIAAGDQEPGRGIARQVVVEGEVAPLVFVAQFRLGCRPREGRRRTGPTNQPAREDFVLMTLGTDQEWHAEERRAIAARIAVASAEVIGIRAALVEAGSAGSGLRRRRRASDQDAREHDDADAPNRRQHLVETVHRPSGLVAGLLQKHRAADPAPRAVVVAGLVADVHLAGSRPASGRSRPERGRRRAPTGLRLRSRPRVLAGSSTVTPATRPRRCRSRVARSRGTRIPRARRGGRRRDRAQTAGHTLHPRRS